MPMGAHGSSSMLRDRCRSSRTTRSLSCYSPVAAPPRSGTPAAARRRVPSCDTSTRRTSTWRSIQMTRNEVRAARRALSRHRGMPPLLLDGQRLRTWRGGSAPGSLRLAREDSHRRGAPWGSFERPVRHSAHAPDQRIGKSKRHPVEGGVSEIRLAPETLHATATD